MPEPWEKVSEIPEFKSLSPEEKFQIGQEHFAAVVQENRDYIAESPENLAQFEEIKKDFDFKLAEDYFPNAAMSIPSQIAESFVRGGRNDDVQDIKTMMDQINSSKDKLGAMGDILTSERAEFEGMSDDEIAAELEAQVKPVENGREGLIMQGEDRLMEFNEARDAERSIPQLETRVSSRTAELLQSLEESSKRTPSASMMQFEIAGGFKEYMKRAGKSKDATKLGALAGLMAGASSESFNESMQGLLAGAGATAVTGGNIFAGAGAAATVEYKNEYLNTYQAELLKEVNELGGPTEENVKKVLGDDSFNERVDKKAKARGIIIGGVGGVSQLVSGGIAKKLFGGVTKAGKSATKQALKSASVESLMNIPAEGTGEALALAATEDVKLSDLARGKADPEFQNQVTLEMAGAGGQGPVQTIGVGLATAINASNSENMDEATATMSGEPQQGPLEATTDQEAIDAVFGEDPLLVAEDDVSNITEIREQFEKLTKINEENPSQVTLMEQTELADRLRVAEGDPRTRKAKVETRRAAEEAEAARIAARDDAEAARTSVVDQMQTETQAKSRRIGVIDRTLDFGVDEKSEAALLVERARLQKELDGVKEPEFNPTLGDAFDAKVNEALEERAQIKQKIDSVNSGLAPEILASKTPVETADALTSQGREALRVNQNKIDLLSGQTFTGREPITTKSGKPQKGFKSELEAAGFRNRQPDANARGLQVVEREDGRFVVTEPTFKSLEEVEDAQDTLTEIAGPIPTETVENQDASLEAVREDLADPAEQVEYEEYSENAFGLTDSKALDRITSRQKPAELDDGKSELRAKSGFRKLIASLIYDENRMVPDWFRVIADQFANNKKGAKMQAQNAVSSMAGHLREEIEGATPARAPRIETAALEFLRGGIPSIRLSSDLLNSLAVVRNLIDEFTGMAIASGGLHPATEKAYAANLGEYMVRSYKVMDPSYNWSVNTIKKNDPALYSRAVNHFMAKGQTQAEAEVTVASIADPARAQGFIEFGRSFNNLPPSYFRSRKNIEPIVRELMGEITDPFDVAARSLDKVSTIAFEASMQKAMVEAGIAMGVISNKSTPINSAELSLDSVQQQAFGQLYSDRVTAQVLSSAMARAKADRGVINDLAGLLAGATAASKFLTVIASPYGVQTNAIGAIGTEMFAGRTPLQFGKGLKAHFLGKVKRATRSPKSRQETLAQRDAYLSQPAKGWNPSMINTDQLEVEMESAGIFNQNVFAQDFLHGLDRSMEKGSPLRQITSKAGIFGKAFSAATRGMADVYQSPDNAVKANAFLFEASTYAKAFPSATLGEVFEMAGADVLRDTQNYAKVPGALRALSTYGGMILPISPYISFSSELMRSYFANYMIAARQLASGNPVLMRRGARRVAGAIAMHGAAFALKARLNRASGLDEEEREFFREFYLPDFHNQKSITFIPSKEGRLKYLDDTYGMPQIVFSAPFAESARAAMDGDEDTDAAVAFLNSFQENITGQFEGDSQVRDALTGLLRNRDSNGREIFPEALRGQENADVEEARARMAYAIKSAYMPTIVRSGERMLSEETVGYFGNVNSRELEFQKMVGIRPFEIDINASTPTIQKGLHTQFRALKGIPEEKLAGFNMSEASRQAAMDAVKKKYMKFREKSIKFGVATEQSLRVEERKFNKEFRGW